MRAQYDSCRTRLGRLRCLRQCIAAYKSCETFPEPLGYVCQDIPFKCTASFLDTHTAIKTFNAPTSSPNHSESNQDLTSTLKDVLPVGSIQCDSDTEFFTNGQPMVTHYGMWLKVFAVNQGTGEVEKFHPPIWVLQQGMGAEESPYLESLGHTHDAQSTAAGLWKENDDIAINNWLGVVEATYCTSVTGRPEVAMRDSVTMAELLEVPPNWSRECDEQLICFLSEITEFANESLGIVKNFVDAIQVSTCSGDDDENNLIDGNPETFWESDGTNGEHWIRLKMKRGTIINRLYITLDMDDDNYLPNHVMVAGGELEEMETLSDTRITLERFGIHDECVLTDVNKHYPYIEIRIKECKDQGIDTRIHGIKLTSSKGMDMGLSMDLFADKSKFARYPALETYSKKLLYRRAQILQRLALLIDSVLSYLVPSWNESKSSLNFLNDVKQLLLLSKKRMALIDTFLKDSESSRSRSRPVLMINRRSAAEHRDDPTADLEATATVFNQIYEGLKPKTAEDSALDYRWPGYSEQWWECKFVSEGIIDQGGGFRDSLCDISEELCPANPDDPVITPYFMRAPNQTSTDSNMSRDVFIPNPGCKQTSKYRWIGQLMGACLRGRESLILSLPAFVWKKLTDEIVNWETDFCTVDALEVKLLERMVSLDEEAYGVHFGDKTWTFMQSDGIVKELKPDGDGSVVLFTDREEYCNMVKQQRMAECDLQIEAMKEGLLSVVPEAVLNLLTWQEIEKKVCGDPEISIEGLKASVHYDDIEPTDPKIVTFWEVMEKFSNEDRSRFLRFVTGRKRLPCPLYISTYKSSAQDGLPESSTCSNTLYLPRYSSAKIAEKKMRYAAYNCIAIDTDVNPWD